MNFPSILMALEGIISSAPEAVALWNKVVPLLAPKADVRPEQLAQIGALVPVAQASVGELRQTISNVFAERGLAPPVNMPPSNNTAPAA